jgi:hypothetical protein
MTVIIAAVTAVLGLMVGGTLGVFVGAALGAHRREELEENLAWYERLLKSHAAAPPTTELHRGHRHRVEHGA